MKQSHVYVLLVAMLCSFGWAQEPQPIEVTLEYECYPDANPERRYFPVGSASLDVLQERPEGDWKLPTRVSSTPLYAWVSVGDQERLLVFDKQSRRSKFYDRLYFDANGNRDLTDGKTVDADHIFAHDSRFPRAYFPAMDVEALVDGVPMPYSFTVNLGFQSFAEDTRGGWFRNLFRCAPPELEVDTGFLHAHLRTNCMYTAELTLNGAPYQLYLSDADTNGRFDDWGALEKQSEHSDRVRASGDRFYLVEADASLSYYDRQSLGRYLCLKDDLYEVAIHQTGRRLTLTPVTEDKAAVIELPMAVHRICLMAEDAAVMAVFPEKRVLAPPGAYRLIDYMLFRDEPGGARWRLVAGGTWDGTEVIVQDDTVATYALGEPFRPVVSVPEWSRRNMREINAVDIEMKIVGAGMEVVQDLACIENPSASSIAMASRNEQRPKEGVYRLIKPDGEVAAQGNFEYG